MQHSRHLAPSPEPSGLYTLHHNLGGVPVRVLCYGKPMCEYLHVSDVIILDEDTVWARPCVDTRFWPVEGLSFVVVVP